MKKSNTTSGKIYCLKSKQTDKIYVGSTNNKYLSNRLAGDKCDYKRYLNEQGDYITSFELVKFADVYIELITEHSDISKEMLRELEGVEIRKQRNVCVNKRIETRTRNEYYVDNSDTIKQRVKLYSVENADKIKEYKKEYYVNNLDKIRQQQAIKVVCGVCGGKYSISHKAKHMKSTKHLEAV